MSFHLVCTNPFKKYTVGQKVTDADEVERLLRDRGHHFVKTAAPEVPPAPPPAE